jgi:hypothetical protein
MSMISQLLRQVVRVAKAESAPADRALADRYEPEIEALIRRLETDAAASAPAMTMTPPASAGAGIPSAISSSAGIPQPIPSANPVCDQLIYA